MIAALPLAAMLPFPFNPFFPAQPAAPAGTASGSDHPMIVCKPVRLRVFPPRAADDPAGAAEADPSDERLPA